MIRRPPRSPLFPYPPLFRSLLNRLAGVRLTAADRLFVTLDPAARLVEPAGHQAFILTDTVGFIRKLPHELVAARSEEHTSELQSPCNLVCRLLLEKKKNNND